MDNWLLKLLFCPETLNLQMASRYTRTPVRTGLPQASSRYTQEKDEAVIQAALMQYELIRYHELHAFLTDMFSQGLTIFPVTDSKDLRVIIPSKTGGESTAFILPSFTACHVDASSRYSSYPEEVRLVDIRQVKHHVAILQAQQALAAPLESFDSNVVIKYETSTGACGEYCLMSASKKASLFAENAKKEALDEAIKSLGADALHLEDGVEKHGEIPSRDGSTTYPYTVVKCFDRAIIKTMWTHRYGTERDKREFACDMMDLEKLTYSWTEGQVVRSSELFFIRPSKIYRR